MADNPDEKPEIENSLVKGDFKFTDVLGISEFGILAKTVAMRVCDAIGVVYHDQRAKKHADDKAYEIAVTEQAKTAAMVHHQEQLLTLEGRSEIRVGHQQLRQQENLEAITRHAMEHANEIEDKSAPAEAQIDAKEWGAKNDDWLAEFFDITKNTSEEHMREMWGRVLAQEVKKPDSFSLQALMTLKTMSPKAAKVFEKICALNAEPFGLVKTERGAFLSTSSFGLSFSEVLTARECGLLNSSDATHQVGVPGAFFAFNYFDQHPAFVNNTDNDVKIEVLLLTEVGQELSSIPSVEKNSAYFDAVIAYLKKLGLVNIDELVSASQPPTPEQ